MNYLARHSVAVFALTSAALGLGMGVNGIYEIGLYESHVASQHYFTLQSAQIAARGY